LPAESIIHTESPVNSIHSTVFAVVDVETTGLSPERNRITEIGIVKIRNGEVIAEYEKLLNPGQFIPHEISRLTGITNEMVYDKPSFEEIAGEVVSFLFSEGENIVFGGHNVTFDFRFLNTSLERAGYNKLTIPSLCTARLARRLNRSLPSKSLSSLRRHFNIQAARKHRALDDAKSTAVILTHFIEQLVTDYETECLDELLAYQYRKVYQTGKLTARFKKLKVSLKDIPKKPGIYYMYNRNNDIIYVGKAKNLKDRVSSYFYHNTSHSTKVRKMVRYVHNLSWETTGSELSALLLESRLIKTHKPKFNSAIKSYRKFPFIKIDVQRTYPRVQRVYEIIPDGAKYYGPFSSSFTVNSLIERIHKNYKLRRCDDINLYPAKKKSTCMYYEIGQCSAPCNFSVSLKQYSAEVKKVDRFLTTEEDDSAVKYLENEMIAEAEQLEFEKASYLRDNIYDLRKELLNIELTNSIVEMQNYIIRCKEDNSKHSWEIFLMVNGKIAKTFSVDLEEEPDNDFVSNITEDINYLYFNGALFRDFVFSKTQHKFKIDEIDTLRIITNWVYRNYKPSRILKLTPKSDIKEVMKFIFNTKAANI
jgi:DNA polymerase-3 subunit epsilon